MHAPPAKRTCVRPPLGGFSCGGRSAAEAFGRGGRPFGRRGVQPRRGFSCGGGSVMEAGQLRRCSATEAGGSATEAFGRGGGGSAVEAV